MSLILKALLNSNSAAKLPSRIVWLKLAQFLVKGLEVVAAQQHICDLGVCTQAGREP
jgi:hypothetical protein